MLLCKTFISASIFSRFLCISSCSINSFCFSCFLAFLFCFCFLTVSDFAYKSYTISKDQFEVLTKAENSLDKIKSAVNKCNQEELSVEMILSIVENAKDPKGHYRIDLQETSKQGLYTIEIIFEESRYEKLWTQIYLP